MTIEKKPKLIGYSVMDNKGRITIPYKQRKGVKGYLVSKYENILILIDPRVIEG